MGNNRNVIVSEAFRKHLKKHFATESIPVKMKSRNWQNQFSYRLSVFIEEELRDFDEDLYSLIKDTTHQKYPSAKTLERAFVSGNKISEKLLHLCGWYTFQNEWRLKQDQFLNINTNDEEKSDSKQSSDLKTNKEASSIFQQVNTLLSNGDIRVALDILEQQIKVHFPDYINGLTNLGIELADLEKAQIERSLTREEISVGRFQIIKRLRLVLSKIVSE